MDQPELLYHYTSRETAFEHILPEHRLRLSSYNLMGDPLEAKEWQFGAAYFLPDDADHRSFERTFWKSQRVANDLKRRTKLLALTEDAAGDPTELFDHSQGDFNRGWARARMWERYGEGHRGICLAFRKEQLSAVLNAALEEQGAERILEGPVAYTDGGLGAETSSITLSLRADEPDADKLVARHFDDHAQSLFFAKTREWETEYEYRYVALTESSAYAYVDFGDALEYVIAGDQFPAVDIPGALQIATAFGVETKQMRWENFRPWLFPMHELGTTKDIRARLERYRAGAAQSEAPYPPFRSLPTE